MIQFSHNAQRYLFCNMTQLLLKEFPIRMEPLQYGLMSIRTLSQGKLYDMPAKKGNVDEALEESLLTKADSRARMTKYALCAVLNSCAKTVNWHLGSVAHAQIIQNGYEDNVILSSALVDFYAKCNRFEDARRIFNGMKKHDQVSWTSIISGYAQFGHGVEAFSLFKNMLKTDIKPNCFTYVTIITACSGLEESLELGSLVHAHVIKLGFMTNFFLVSALIDFYSKSGRVDGAALIFDAATARDDILYNSMISGYCRNLYCEDALNIFIQMREQGINPTNFTMSSVLNACGSLSVLFLGRQVHCLVIKLGSVANVFVLSSLIDMYSKSGSIDEARSIFDQTIKRNSVLWTSMISGYAQSGRAIEGLQLFDHMVEDGYVPDHICFTAVLTACNHAGFLNRAAEYFDKMSDSGMLPKLDQYACLVDLHARKGDLKTAIELMDKMPFDPNSVILSSLLGCCKTYGAVELGRKVASRLFDLQPSNAAAYVTMAHIYAEAGLWEEVTTIKKLMRQNRIKKSAAWSWVELDARVDVFLVGDMSHPKSQDIYVLLDLLNLEITDVISIRKECQSSDAFF